MLPIFAAEMRLPIWLILCGTIVLAVATGCNNLEQIQKSKDFEYKRVKADEFYNKKKYDEANVLYEELLTVFKGTKIFEDMYYKYAYSFYYQGNYLAASYHFKNFVDIFPNNAKRDEMEYQYCICMYKMSPESALDQSSTYKAISALQNFVNTHPESNKLEEANKIIDEARTKLEAKDKEGAELYYKIGEFLSANTSFNLLIKKYPDSPNADYFQYMILKSAYEYALLSVPAKQQERLNTALVAHTDLIVNYPNTKYKSDADKLKNTIFALQKKSK
jgi:outer membrane protein assembly factor BamD